jgi:transposase InsO family protein
VSITRCCRLFGVTRAGYYAWRGRQLSVHAQQDRILTLHIQRVFAAHNGRYGSPRVYRALQGDGVIVSRRRVARLMRAAGLRGKAVRGYRARVGVHRFYEQHPNRIRRAVPTGCNQIWVGDITYLAVAGRWRYLAVIMDQYSRRVIAWTLRPRRDASVTRAVLNAAVGRRSPPDGLIFHSDRGSEYLAERFRDRLRHFGILQSANQRGPEDNAHMESFFHTLKAETTRGVMFAADGSLRELLQRYFRYYNHERLHSALGYQSPVAFEARAA